MEVERKYELVVVYHPDLEIDIDTPVAKLEKFVDSNSGKIIKRDNWGKKRLAYKINGLEFGIYVYFELGLLPESVRKLEQSLLIADEVIRFLITSKPVLVPAKKSKAENKPANAESK